jgi:hypothetical protein
MTDEQLTAIEQQAQATLRVELACEADGEPVSTAGILARMLRDVCADLRAARAELAALRPTEDEAKAEDVVGARADLYSEDWTRLECKSSVNTLIRAAVRRRKARARREPA